MYRDILLEFAADDDGLKRLNLALALAGRYRAHVTGFHLVRDAFTPPLFRPSMVASVDRMLKDHEIRAAKAAELAFRDHTTGSGVSWAVEDGPPLHAARQLASFADLVIVGQNLVSTEPEHDSRTLAEDLLRGCGRPVLITPDGIDALQPPARAWVLWDGTPNIARAIHDAVPLLRDAAHVTVSRVVDRREATSRQDGLTPLTIHLARHGVHKVATGPLVMVGDSEVFREFIEQQQIDFLVLGAPRRGRLQSFLFGDANVELVEQDRACVLAANA